MALLAIIKPLPIAAVTASRGSGAANLVTRDPFEAWVDGSAGTPTVITIDLGASRSIDTICLGYVRAEAFATWSITAGVAAANERVVQPTDTLRVPDVLGDFEPVSFALWQGDAFLARYIAITVAQPAGAYPLTAGVAVVGRAFVASLGQEWGGGRRPIDTGTATPLPSGGWSVVEGVRKRQFGWTFGDLSVAEADRLELIGLALGETVPGLVIEDTARTAGLRSRMHYGLFERWRAYERRNRRQTRWEISIEDWGGGLDPDAADGRDYGSVAEDDAPAPVMPTIFDTAADSPLFPSQVNGAEAAFATMNASQLRTAVRLSALQDDVPMPTLPPKASIAQLRAYVLEVEIGFATRLDALESATPTPTPTPAPSFSISTSITSDGTPQVGETLTGNDGVVSGGTVTARQWLLGSTAISGATSAAFVPTQVGAHSFRVTATGPGGTTTSTATITVAAASSNPAPSFTASPSITTDGTPQVGETLTGVDGTIANGNVSGRRWLFNGTQVATTANYAPTQTGVHTFEVTATGAGGTTTATATVTVAAAAAQPIVIDRAAWAESDDFESGPTSVAARTGWIDTGGKYKTRSGSIYADNLYGQYQTALFGGNYTDAFEVEIDYDRSDPGYDTQRQYFTVLESSATDQLQWVVTDQGSMGFRKEDGASTPRILPSGDVPEPSPGKGTIKLRVLNRRITGMSNGVWYGQRLGFYGTPADNLEDGVIALSEIDATKTFSGKLGIHSSAWTYNLAGAVRVRPLACAITTHPKFVGRKSASVQNGDVTMKGYFNGSPVRWVYRLVDYFSRTTEVQAWRDVVSVSTAGSNWTAVINVPLGGPYSAEVGFIDAAGKFNGDTSKAFSCGYVVLNYGQSNSRSRGEIVDVNGIGEPITRLAATNYPDNSTQFDSYKVFYGNGVGDYSSATNSIFCALTASAVVNKPVLVVTGGQDATGLTGLVPGTGAWTNLTNRVAGIEGIVDIVVWDQGENETNVADSTRAQYAANFRDQLAPNLRTLCRNPSLKILLAPPGRVADSGTDWAARDAAANELRQQFLAIVAEPANNASFSSYKTGVRHRDGLHYVPDQTGLYWTLKKDGKTAAKALGGSTADGRGPIPSGVTRSGATITIAMDMNGAASLEAFSTVDTGVQAGTFLPNTIKGYQVSADNFATLLAASSIAVAGNTIVITLAAAPSGPVKVRSFYGLSYNDTELAKGSYADGRKSIPVAPIWAPLTSN